MRDYLSVGSSPCNEECAQVGSVDYSEMARKECQRFIAEIRNVCGQEPEGARLTIRLFPHDFGTYREVVCYYDDKYPDSVEYAFWVEGNSTEKWGEGVNQRRWNDPSKK